MDWSKAKNYTIIFLLMLNILLLGLNSIKEKKYILSNERYSDIKKILNQNNIDINAELPKEFKPMPQLNVSSYNYDVMEIQNMFFQDKENIKRTEELGKTIFRNDKEVIIIQNNTITYISKVNNNKSINEKEAVSITSKYISKISKKFSNMDINRVFEYNDRYEIFYSQKFIGNYILSNYIFFTVYKDGKIIIELKYNEAIDFGGQKIDIKPADEILFIFIDEIRKTYNDLAITIDKIDLGYFLDDVSTQNNSSSMTAVPYYRIFLSDSTRPYFINAYNGMIYQE